MKNYVLIYFNNGVRPNLSPEDSKAEWGQWFGGLGEAIVDAGNPFGDGKTVSKDSVEAVKDGAATGYSIVKAGSLEEAVELAKGCPVLSEPDGAIRVYETLPM